MKTTDAAFVPNALKLTEQSIQLLRQNGIPILAEYYVGSLPFIFGLLYFWSDMSRSTYAAVYCSEAAAGLALLFIWMKYWHVRFCRRLWCVLLGTTEKKRPFGHELATVGRQALLQATGMIVQPVSMIIAIPLAWTYAFYQNVTVMDRLQSNDLKTLFQSAVRQSKLWPGQNHLILCILSFFALFVFFNVSVVLMVLPYILKKLTGIETAFTISGIHAMTNTTFFATACALTYLCVDPVIKSVYTLRCFYSQSRSTGDDIRIGLKPFLITTLVAVLIWVPMIGPFSFVLAQNASSRNTSPMDQAATIKAMTTYADQLNESIDDVLQRPQFSWRMPREKLTEKDEIKNTWLKTGLEWFFDKLGKMMTAIWDWVESMLDWFSKYFPKKDAANPESHALETVVRIIFGLIAVGLMILLMVIIHRYLKYKWLNQTRTPVLEPADRPVDLNDETLTAADLPYDRWLALSKESMESKDFRQALRALYLAILAQLGDKHRIGIARYKSNRDYLVELSTHSHAEPELFELFETCIKMFERFWYGMHPVAMDKLIRFKACQERISAIVQ
ncbi:MAG: hypothetical protein FP816_19210 [Desulfobacteraceae bacterium]|nr:hypothetical protein [Desulfobacteraceae bacterium]